MTPPKPPPLLEWSVENRSSLVGMRNGTVFVRLERVVVGMDVKYRIHLTFPLPRGIVLPNVLLRDIERAKAAAEEVFSRWLKAVLLAPVKPPPAPRKPSTKKA